MSRPLIQKRIDELEALFETQHGDAEAMRGLENELSFRTVPRANNLRQKVKRVLAGGTVLPAATQDTLFEHKQPVAVQEPLLPEVAKAPTPPALEMSVEEARKTLKIGSASSWETVETSRRQIVDKARPDKLAA